MIDTRQCIGWFRSRGCLLLCSASGHSPHCRLHVPAATGRQVQPLPSFSEPAISRDRSEIAVVSGGDIWTVPVPGGEARLLVAHEAAESRPLNSPEGDRLAFVSERTGGGDIYVLTLATGVLTQLTVDDGLERVDAWSRDGRWVHFSSTSRPIAGMNDLYRVRADGGTPMLRAAAVVSRQSQPPDSSVGAHAGPPTGTND